jgi:hippurate hydrolase
MIARAGQPRLAGESQVRRSLGDCPRDPDRRRDHVTALDDTPASDAISRARHVIGDVDTVLDAVDALYRDLHQYPELSQFEEQTSAKVAARLDGAGLEVATHVGGFGVVGVLRNGDGPVVALRGDMDALPIHEDTDLPYASQVSVTRDDGSTVGVMHACGHDLHTSCLVGAAELLAANRDAWRGTLFILAQPAEETISGAAAMLADGLFSRFPRPDVVLGQHAMHARAEMLLHRPDTFLAASRNLEIRIFGKGGHGSSPHVTIDPVLMAAQAVVALQAVVSREISPNQPAVVTVGSIHGGTRYNIVPPEVTLQVTTRGLSEPVMDQIQAAIERIVNGVCAAARAPKEPQVTVCEQTYATVNDPATTARVRAVHEALFGDDVVSYPEVIMGSEDFALYGMPGAGRYDEPAIPTAFWFVGTLAADRWDAAPGTQLLDKLATFPGPHTPHFAPDRTASLRRGLEALTAALVFLDGPAA